MHTLLKISVIFLLVTPFYFSSAQEVSSPDPEEAEVQDTADLLPAPELINFVDSSPSIAISEVRSTKNNDGSTELTWKTNLLSAGAVTVLYREGAGYPDQLVQQRLTSGEISTEHRYVLRGLRTGEYSVVIEAVGVDMQYDRFTGMVSISEAAQERSPFGFLLAWFVSISFLIVMVVLYEIVKHRSEFAKAMKELKKAQVKTPAKRIYKRKNVRAKVATKTVKKKAVKKTTKKTASKK